MPLSVTKIDVKPIHLDFRSSGQDELDAMSVSFNDSQFFNAIEFLCYDDIRLQTQICDCCGSQGCASGSWVSLRRCDTYAIFIPALEAMSEGKWQINEYAPPDFLRRYGIPVLTNIQYAELIDVCKRLPPLNTLPELNMRDCLAVLQLEAPGNILGKLGRNVQFNFDNFIAVTEGNLEDELSTLNRLLESACSDNEQTKVGVSYDRKIEFILDLPGFPSWTPFGYTGGEAHFFIDFAKMHNELK